MNLPKSFKIIYKFNKREILKCYQICRYTSNLLSVYPKEKPEENYYALNKTSEDLSTITSYFPKSFNLAAYVNNSDTLQHLLYFNVNLSKIDKKPFVAEKILKLNFDDVRQRLLFLQDYVHVDNIGDFLTKNALILCEQIEDIKARVNYLESKQFKQEDISRIITKNPFWLMFSTVRIDKRLGFYQEKFDLCGNEVRSLATKCPKIITYNLHHVQTNSFVIKEEMGFKDLEAKQLILSKPKLWMLNQRILLERFNYIHNVIKIPHEKILHYPNILLCRIFKIKQRHIFLEKLGRAQYNPATENYVPLSALVEDTDVEFCKKYAKCHIDDYNIFLKTI